MTVSVAFGVFSNKREVRDGRRHISEPSSAICGVPVHWRTLRVVCLGVEVRSVHSLCKDIRPLWMDSAARAGVSRTRGICGSLMSQLSFIPWEHAPSACCPASAGIWPSSLALSAQDPERQKKNKPTQRCPGDSPPVLGESGERQRQRD